MIVAGPINDKLAQRTVSHLLALADRWESVGQRAEKAPTKGFLDEIPPLRARAAVLPIVARYREVKRARGVLDFADGEVAVPTTPGLGVELDGDRLAVAFGTGIGGVWTLLDAWDVLRDKGPRRVMPMTVPRPKNSSIACHHV